MQLRAKIKRAWRKMQGYRDCPICKEQTLQFVKDWIIHPEEPPLFGHWQCFNKNCLVSTDMESLPWADKVAQEQGHRTFKEALFGEDI